MDADHTWIPVVQAADCTPCPGCGEAICPRCNDHYAECPCPGPHQNDQFYYRTVAGKLQAIPRDAELDQNADREPADDFAAEQRVDDEAEHTVEDDFEGAEPDDDGEPESLLDRLDAQNLDETPNQENEMAADLLDENELDRLDAEDDFDDEEDNEDDDDDFEPDKA